MYLGICSSDDCPRKSIRPKIMGLVCGRVSGPRLWDLLRRAGAQTRAEAFVTARREHNSLLAVREVVFCISTISSEPEESPVRNLETRPVP